MKREKALEIAQRNREIALEATTNIGLEKLSKACDVPKGTINEVIYTGMVAKKYILRLKKLIPSLKYVNKKDLIVLDFDDKNQVREWLKKHPIKTEWLTGFYKYLKMRWYMTSNKRTYNDPRDACKESGKISF